MTAKLNRLRAIFESLTEGSLVGWIGQRALDCVGLSQILPIHFIVCCDYGMDIAEWGADKFFLSIEKKDGVRRNWSNSHLDMAFKNQIGETFQSYSKNKRVQFACYRSVGFLENLRMNLPQFNTVAAVPLELKNYFDNKITFYEKLPELGLNVIPGEITTLPQTNYKKLNRKYGLPFVVQLPIGSSGNNTFIIYNQKEFDHIIPRLRDSWFKVTKFLPGFSLNMNIALFRGQTYVSAPSIQIVGARECTTRPAIFCGNDFTAATCLPMSIISEAFNVSHEIAAWLNQEGFRGIFGLDLMVSDNKIYPIEINPRWQNSTDLLTISQIRHRQLPLISLHLLEFLTTESPLNGELLDYHESYQPQSGAQIILHNLERETVTNAGTIRPGVYTFNTNGLQFERPGFSLFDCSARDEFVINCGVPYPGQTIHKGAPICKIQAPDTMLAGDKIHLNDKMSKIARKIYQQFDLKKINQ